VPEPALLASVYGDGHAKPLQEQHPASAIH